MENTLLNIGPSSPVYRWELGKSRSILAMALERSEAAKELLEEAAERWEVKPQQLAEELLNQPQLQLMVTDAYYLHYTVSPLLRREALPDPVMEGVRQGFQKYRGTEEYARARAYTVLDRDLSNIYRLRLAEELLPEILRQLLREPPPSQKHGSSRGGQQAQALRKALARAVAHASKKAAKALEKAAEKTEEDAEVAGLLAGDKPGRFEKTLRISERRVVDIGKIVSLARRIEAAVYTRVRLYPSPMGYIEGYRRTRRVERAIARELALPDELVLAKIAGNGFTSWDKRLPRRGAYYVVVDKSGSMNGEKTVWARSVALALLWKARSEGADYRLQFFDTLPRPEHPAGYGEAEELLATIISDGGTDIDAAIHAALRYMPEADAETLVLITDGEDDVSTHPDELLKAGVRLVAVMVAGDNPALRRLAEKSGGQYLSVKPTEEGALRIVEATNR